MDGVPTLICTVHQNCTNQHKLLNIVTKKPNCLPYESPKTHG